MSHLIHRYGSFSSAELQVLLTYRSSFLLAIVTNAISLLAQLFVWRAIYGATSATLAGYSLAQVTSYVLISNMLYIALDNRVDDDIAADVMRGDIVIHFLRPVNYLATRLFAALPVMLLNLVLVSLPVAALGAMSFGLQAPAPADCALFACSACLSLVIGFALNAMVGALAFVTTNIWGARLIKSAVIGLLSGYVIPLSFLSPGLRGAVAWLPFQSMINTPVNLFLGHYSGVDAALATLGQQALWGSVLLAACFWLWDTLAGKLELNGG
jgi:ABC-2 type transport system permease protein